VAYPSNHKVTPYNPSKKYPVGTKLKCKNGWIIQIQGYGDTGGSIEALILKGKAVTSTTGLWLPNDQFGEYAIKEVL
jgi:hypothetical protein